MKFKTNPTLLTSVIILTLLLTWFVGSVTEREMRNNLLLQTQIGANCVDVARIKKLTGTISDLKSPDYLRLKQQLSSIVQVDNNLYFVYIMGVKKDGKVFFLVDDRPDEHPEGSNPGSSYDEAPIEFNTVMQTGIPTVEGPSADSWGSYASGCAPIIDPETGKPIAIFAIDFVTSSWYWKIILRSILPAGLAIALMTALLFMFISKQKEKLLKSSEEKYRFMFDNNPQPNWIFDVNTLLFLEVNESAIRHYGYSKQEFLTMTIKDIHPTDDISNLLKDIKELHNSYNKAGEWKHLKKNGELIYVDIVSHSIIFNGGNSRHVLAHDITDRKLAEIELLKTKTELEQLHNNLNEAVFSVDLIQNKIIYASIAHQTVFGHSPDEFLKNPQLWYEIIVSEDRYKIDAGYSVLLSGKKLINECRINHPNGEIHWIETKLTPTLDMNGQVIRIDGVAYDITQRKQIETKLIESEINFRRSISDSPIGIRIVTSEGKTIYGNKTFLDLFELNSLEEFINVSAKDLYTPDSYEQHQERKKKREAGNDVFDYEISIKCVNKEIRHIKVSRKELMWNGKKHVQVINLDITKQRNAEEQLRKLSIAVEQSPDAICLTDPDGIIEYVNPRTIDLTGYSIEELVGLKTNIFSSGEKTKEEYTQLWQTIKSGNVWSGELHNKKKNGELYWESTSISPIFNKTGQITHFLSIKEDITGRKFAEIALNNSEEQLRKFASHLQNVREEEKISVAREIHDDLGQILVALKIDMGLLKQKVIKTNIPANCEDVLPGFNNVISLIDKTIKTSRRIMNGLRTELLELHGLEVATKEYLQEFEERYSIHCEYVCDIHKLEINQQQSLAFFRILQEALNNISKHSKASLVNVQLNLDTNTLVLKITDNGIGFDKNQNSRQDSYGMIGMKERVVLLNGKLDITSKIGMGTCISVEIPYITESL